VGLAKTNTYEFLIAAALSASGSALLASAMGT